MSSLSPSIEDLPGNVMADVLSRLPVKKIIHCKCVCKNWRELVSDSYFVSRHLSRSPPGIMIVHNREPQMYSDSEEDMSSPKEPGILKWVEIRDEFGNTHLHRDLVMSFNLNLTPTFRNSNVLQVGSVNGLVCLWQYQNNNDNTYICNPITREYMSLPRQKYYKKGRTDIVYGFGVGLLTKAYKVIRIFQGDKPPKPASSRPRLLEAEVYTLGTGKWRHLGHVFYWLEKFHGPFLNGCVHWIVLDEDSPEKLYAFDIDNETFQLFPSPPCEDWDRIRVQSLGVLNGFLSQSDTTDWEFTIWVMKEYGVKRSWHKEVVIRQNIAEPRDWWMHGHVFLIECLKDGTIFMLFEDGGLLVYLPQKKSIEEKPLLKPFFTGIAYRPSFLKLQTFESETVHVLESSRCLRGGMSRPSGRRTPSIITTERDNKM
ncbi:F-box associated domain, type 1 [Artemisia annua]|uniref:F-box associated domain, type 1 n=1 Tax=Artemisia annua TaxID=35608 RepID=A0A2U1PDZ2_ARTAN|nr:F-box associated domain, type 1 [Artemisia annua]